MDAPRVGALALVAAEWLVLGQLSGLTWPGASFRVARWSLFLLSGAFLVGLSQLLLALVTIGFASPAAVLVLAAVLATGVRLFARRQSPSPTPPIEHREAIGWAVLGLVLLAATVRSMVVPEAGWDAFSHWGLKARAFASLGTIADAGTVHEYYPPLVPLLEAWLFLHRGSVSIDQGKVIWALVGSAFAVCLGWHLRLALRSTWLAPFFAVGIVLTTTQLLDGFWTGQADLALSAYLTLATLAVWQWQRTAERAWLVQAALFAAACGLTKYEGLPRVAVLVVAVLLVAVLERCRSRALPALVMGLVAGAAYLPWLAFRALHNIGGSSEHFSQFQPAAIPALLLALLSIFSGFRTGGALLVPALTAVLARGQLLDSRYRLLTLVVLGQLGMTLLAFLVSDTAPDVQALTSATRLFEHFLPVALFGAALWLDERRPIIRPWR